MQSRRQTVAIIETRPACGGLAAALERSGGFAIAIAATPEAAAALTAARAPRIQALVLDLAPGADGAAMCRRLRGDGVHVPVLVLSPADGEAELVACLEAGASDYIVKPCRFGELAARIRAQIRAVEMRGEPVLPIGRYEFRPARRLLTHPGIARPIRLTFKEADLLAFLYRCSPAPASRQTIMREVWGYAQDARSHTIESHIYRLRRKIQPDPDGALLLINDADGGYRLGYEPGPAAVPMRSSSGVALQSD